MIPLTGNNGILNPVQRSNENDLAEHNKTLTPSLQIKQIKPSPTWHEWKGENERVQKNSLGQTKTNNKKEMAMI